MPNIPLETVTIVVRVCSIAADIVIIAVTVSYTYGTFKASLEVNIRTPFSSLLLRAGQLLLNYIP